MVNVYVLMFFNMLSCVLLFLFSNTKGVTPLACPYTMAVKFFLSAINRPSINSKLSLYPHSIVKAFKLKYILYL